MLFRAKKKSYNILKISKYFGVWRVYNMKKYYLLLQKLFLLSKQEVLQM